MIDAPDDFERYAWANGDTGMYCITVARDLRAPDFLARWRARVLDEAHTSATIYAEEDWGSGRYGVRVAEVGGYAVGIEFMSWYGSEDRWLEELSRDTEVWRFYNVDGKPLYLFAHFRRGRKITSIDLFGPDYFRGEDPHGLDEHMAQVGILTRPEDGPIPDFRLAALRMIEQISGVQMTEHLMYHAALTAGILGGDPIPPQVPQTAADENRVR